ncbi:hypothetical protein [Nocardia sp. NPDC057227]|uniref:hypothetical protein n=1 Tax=Nocardia sp. NPDC057227 TaxID=3346056 RepID=UPI00363E80F0
MTDEVGISLNKMRSAVTEWNEAAADLQSGVDMASKLEITEGGAGTFAAALAQYQPTPGYFRDRLQEGVTVLRDIATVLAYACDQYEAEELASQATFQRQQGGA